MSISTSASASAIAVAVAVALALALAESAAVALEATAGQTVNTSYLIINSFNLGQQSAQPNYLLESYHMTSLVPKK